MLLGVKVHRRNLESTSGDVWTNQLFIAENAKPRIGLSKQDVPRRSSRCRQSLRNPTWCRETSIQSQRSLSRQHCGHSVLDREIGSPRWGNRANHKRKHLWSPKTSQFRVLFVQQQMETCGTRDHKDEAVWPEWPRCSMQQVRSMK